MGQGQSGPEEEGNKLESSFGPLPPLTKVAPVFPTAFISRCYPVVPVQQPSTTSTSIMSTTIAVRRAASWHRLGTTWDVEILVRNRGMWAVMSTGRRRHTLTKTPPISSANRAVGDHGHHMSRCDVRMWSDYIQMRVDCCWARHSGLQEPASRTHSRFFL